MGKRAITLGADPAAARLVLHARAQPGCAPYGLAVALLGSAVDALAPHEREKAFAGAAGLAAPLFDASAPPLGAPDVAVVHGLYWLTARLADRTPLALIVEDVGQADEQSLRLFAYLAQRVDELPVALVLA